MSTTVDQRIVEMEFDNRRFEENVSDTMGTLDKLNQKLNFTGSAKGFEEISNSASKVDMSTLTSAIESINSRFSAMGVIGMTALQNITNSAIDTGKRMLSALTIDPIKTGFSEYETKIGAIQTIMSNTASKGTTMADVTKTINELNTYADKTIYNFAEMTKNIGTFTAAGVGLEDSATAIQGIANLAAASGSTSQQASTAMYQLSQALSSGTVKLMDWNSVVNAGMGGQLFQDALKESAKEHGIAIDAIIEKNGSFRESLQEGWLSAEVLNTTLKKFTVEGAKEYGDAMIKSGKWTQAQADALIKEATSMEDAATKVKTFTQLWDTLQESAQSGWSQTWEILIGDFEEAKETLTNISNVLGEAVNALSEGRNKLLQGWKDVGGRADVVDSLFNVIDAIKSVIIPIKDAFSEIFPPMTVEQLKGFTEGLKAFTSKLKLSEDGADKLKRTFKGLFSVLDIVRQVLVGVFKVIGGLIFPVSDLGGGILGLTAAIGDWLTNLTNASRESNTFISVMEGIGNVAKFVLKSVSGLINGISDLFSSMGKVTSNAFDSVSSSIEQSGVLGILQNIGQGVTAVLSGVVRVIKSIGESLGNALGDGGMEGILGILKGLISGGIGISLIQFIKSLKGSADGISDVIENAGDAVKNFGSVFENVSKVFGDLQGVLQSYQQTLKAKALLSIAGAIAILAASLLLISLIDSEKLYDSVIAIALLFGVLTASMAAIGKFAGGFGGAAAVSGVALALASAVMILSGALKMISDLKPEQLISGLVGVAALLAMMVGVVKLLEGSKKSVKGATQLVIFAAAIKVLASACTDLAILQWEELAKGLVGVAGLLAAVLIFINTAKFSGGKAVSTAIGVVLIASSIKILASACEVFAYMSWEAISKGLLAVTAILSELLIFTHLSSGAKGMISIGLGMIAIGAAMKIFSSAMKDIAEMTWTELAKGMAGLAGALLSLATALTLMPKNMLATGLGMLAVAAAMQILTSALSDLSSMSWEGIGKGMVALGGSLTILAVALYAMSGTLPGSAAMLVAAAALAILVPTLISLGSVSLKVIATGIIALAATFALLGAAGYLLGPLIPTILGLAGAFALFGIGALALGVGLTAIAAALTTFAVATSAGVAAITDLVYSATIGLVKGIAEGISIICKGILGALPEIGAVIKELVLTICDILVSCAPKIVDTVLYILVKVIQSLGEYIPQLVNAIFDIAIGILNGLSDKVPELIVAAGELFASILEGFVKALGNMDVDFLIQALLTVTLIAGFMVTLAGCAALVPAAMSGAIGIGIVIGEFALILAALGALAQIPGAKWLLGEGGTVLQLIGSAIGKFVGGLIGGFAEGATSSLPKIAENLSDFMVKIQGFLDGARSIDDSVTDGIHSLVDAILSITGAGLVESLASWITGGSSITDFARDIVILGAGLGGFAKALAGANPQNIFMAATAAKALAEMTSVIPNEGGVASWFAGENSIAKFGDQLPALGAGLKEFSDSVDGISQENMTAAVNAAKVLAEMTSTIPNEGGVASWFAGDNSISKFGDSIKELGRGLKGFSDEVSGIVTTNVVAGANAAKILAEMTAIIPNQGGVKSWFTGSSSISKFASEIVKLGKGLKGFSDEVSGIVPDNVTAGATAAKALAEMTAIIPNEGGIKTWFTGESSITSFAFRLPILGRGLKGFSDAIEGVVPENISAAANAAKSLAQITTILPNEGGIKAWFTGESSIVSFGEALPTLGKNLKGFSDSVNGIIPENITAAASAAESLVKFTSSIPNEGGIKAWFVGEASVSKFAHGLPDLGVSLRQFSIAVTGIVPENMAAATNAAKALAEMTSVIPNEGGIKAWFTGEASITKFAGELPKLGSGIKGFSDSVAGIKPEEVSAAANAAKTLGDMTNSIPKNSTKITTFGVHIDEFGNSLKSYFAKTSGIKEEAITASKKAIDSVKALTTINGDNITSISEGIDNIAKSIKNLSQVPKDATSGFKQALSDLGKVSGETLLKPFKNITEDMKEAGQKALEAFVSGMEKSTAKAKKTCSDMVESCANTISDNTSKFKSAGADLVAGFANGISANTYKATAQARAMAKAAAKAAEDALDINSPSKVFYGIGDFAGLGFVNALRDHVSASYSAGSGIGESARDGLTSAIKNIQNIVSGDMDMQPTISPVIDLSNVREAAGSIRKLFGNDPLLAMSTDAGSISLAMNQRNQNGDNSDIILAINKLRSDIANMSGDTYNINGITYDDGSNIQSALQAIIQAARIDRRV